MIVEVVHSQSKNAWNVVGRILGEKYKWARVPYPVCNEKFYDNGENEIIDTREKFEALRIAQFIAEKVNYPETKDFRASCFIDSTLCIDVSTGLDSGCPSPNSFNP